MRFLILAAALLALVLTSSASAQEETGSISGRIYYTNQPDAFCVSRLMFIVPADVAQPIPFDNLESPYYVEVPCDGNYSMSGLAAGDYLIAYEAYAGFLDGFDEELLVHWRGGNQIFPAKRVSLAAGQDLVVDIPITVEIEPTPDRTGPGLHGRVIAVGQEQPVMAFDLMLVPADVEQPVTHIEQYAVGTDTSGRFDVGGLEDGDYLLAFFQQGYQLLTEMPETVTYEFDGAVHTLPAMRITVVDGLAPQVEIRIAIPTLVVIGNPGIVTLPNSGDGPGAPTNPIVWAALLAVAVALASAAIVARRR